MQSSNIQSLTYGISKGHQLTSNSSFLWRDATIILKEISETRERNYCIFRNKRKPSARILRDIICQIQCRVIYLNLGVSNYFAEKWNLPPQASRKFTAMIFSNPNARGLFSSSQRSIKVLVFSKSMTGRSDG